VRGFVPPSDFIPLAEETGLIIDLGNWVLETAIAQLAQWDREVPKGSQPLTMAVNLSPRQFQAPDLVYRLRTALLAHGVAPNRLKLEITETSAMQNGDATIAVLAELTALAVEKKRYEAQYEELTGKLKSLNADIERDTLLFETISGQQREVPLSKVVRIFAPNSMSSLQKAVHYADKVHEFITEAPREANTEGGVFPAIYGTVLLVLMMSVFVTPLGVIAAVYLREYARPGPMTSAIRIAVNNLAGVPSVVYGVFGFGFFVYLIGGSLDEAFFSDSLPSPTFGTPGLLWSSLTLTLLTVPVVIVATEEGLARIPRAIREGSLALGATKAETLWLTVLPMATPAMMTGLILAVARAAGEVAPLMMVGVVKLAPALPLDGDFPYLHLDRKFMHLGFHIYDVGFQSPNVEAARPLVYSTAFLLVVIIMSLNLAAIRLRNRLREKYNATE
jgi:phosphate transport system permease protein